MRAALLCLLLTGCATFDYQWYREREPARTAYAWMQVADPDTLCRQLGVKDEHRILACTDHDRQIIVLPVNPPQWIVAHELRHKNGENHL